MSIRRRFGMAALLTALCLPFATPAQAGWEYCFRLQNGMRYCFNIPIEVAPKFPIDPGPLRAIDISRIAPQLSELVRGETTVIVTDSLGQSAILVDLKAGVAFDLNQNVAR
jgi:hypothetical protein